MCLCQPKAVKDYADHKVTDIGHFTTKHFSKCLLPKFVFINISFGYRVNEPKSGTNSLLNTLQGTGAYNNKVVGGQQGCPEGEKP